MSGIKKIQDDLEPKLQQLLTRAKSTQSSARLYPLYQQLQTQRFMTQGASEGFAWTGLSKEYEKYKEKKYSKYPGGGRKLLIATSTLAGAVIGPGSPFEGTDKHRAIFKPYQMQISVEQSGVNAAGKKFNYPQYVAEKRPFMKFSDKSIELLKESLKKYLIGG
jgi:hypothetical protein